MSHGNFADLKVECQHGLQLQPVAGGNIRLVAAMTKGLRILYNTRAKQISYAKQEVAVRTSMHVFKGPSPSPPAISGSQPIIACSDYMHCSGLQ